VRVAFDTNVLAYAQGLDDSTRKEAARSLLERVPQDVGVIPLQVLGELYNVLLRKGKRRKQAQAAVLVWCDAFDVIETRVETMTSAVDLATAHRLGIWDSLILASAAQGGCRLLLSEDLQDGFTWNGVTVANPFAPRRHPLLEKLLREAE
jgi:predicted nucleic acid-binding protein